MSFSASQIKSVIILLGGCLTLAPRAAGAIQTHGPPEGLYVHQLGHLCFLTAMVFICLVIWRRGLRRQRGFRYIFRAGILLALWNLLTFWGHWAEERLSPTAVSDQAGYFSRQIQITDLPTLLYYLAKLDHLILVPAMLMFYLGLRAFASEGQFLEDR
ncbi:hypothetical protein [Desulfobacca acetoxidans]|uniref:Uncharacterized protein n=1 Tax=Desulfobacca acetoxidans (strain ATCC 700848 / DSM 11109 / ASRB2) TaxID=880072 RepID=F2NE12_DESAR|nr:hypothetical protein [Desulfobacca acetoxidans]AEB10580.1 hypothetical protein Desac_2767 [Desulfobacca acetoxidans DSM 11109]